MQYAKLLQNGQLHRQTHTHTPTQSESEKPLNVVIKNSTMPSSQGKFNQMANYMIMNF